MLVLWQLLWKPYLRVRGERVTRVEGYREEAARMEADAQQRLARAEAALAEARRVGRRRARGGAAPRRRPREQTLLAEANAAAQKTLAEARAQLAATVATERGRLQARGRVAAREAARRSWVARWRRERCGRCVAGLALVSPAGVLSSRRARRARGPRTASAHERKRRRSIAPSRRGAGDVGAEHEGAQIDGGKLAPQIAQLRRRWCSCWSCSAARRSTRRCPPATSS